MILFILWYYVGGIALGIIAVTYSVIYSAKHDVTQKEATKIKNKLVSKIGLTSIYASCGKALRILLDIISFVILPFLFQFFAYEYIKCVDDFITNKKES